MKKTILLFIIGLTGLISFGQTYVSFGYDAAGNRTSRTIAMAKSAYVEGNVTEVFEETLEELSFKLYPNPTKGVLNVEIENFTDGTNASISVFDLQGRQVYNNNNASPTNAVDLSGQSPGTYILILKAGDKTSEWKIVKE